MYQIANYRKFLKIFLNVLVYWAIVYPFIIGFLSGFFLASVDLSFLFYYAIGCFIYICVLVTILGLLIHNYLNLTLRTQKDLFIVKYLSLIHI